VPVRHFDAVNDAPNWKDISPCFGVAYDLFGNGRTAVKASVGRYAESQGVGFTELLNPAMATVLTAARTWTDANGNFVTAISPSSARMASAAPSATTSLVHQTSPRITRRRVFAP
jgi:hypothetical protein